ncbi:MAG: AAA domain-containing protein, partial [Anaerolineae bacterium]|nr:AAA domain-containing protein [Anaerolineae bacterium]
RNTVIIMTSNIGTEYAKQGGTWSLIPSSNGDDEARENKKKIEEGLKKTFRPEFLNRIDEIIIFHTLTLEHMVQIVDLQ